MMIVILELENLIDSINLNSNLFVADMMRIASIKNRKCHISEVILC